MVAVRQIQVGSLLRERHQTHLIHLRAPRLRGFAPSYALNYAVSDALVVIGRCFPAKPSLPSSDCRTDPSGQTRRGRSTTRRDDTDVSFHAVRQQARCAANRQQANVQMPSR